MLISIGLYLVITLSSLAPSAQAGSQPAFIPFEPLQVHLRSREGKDPIIFHITSEVDWKKLQKEIMGGEALPSKIDFKKHQVFGIQEFVRSGGYSIKIERMETSLQKGKPQSFVAKIKRMAPGLNCATTDALESPHDFVLIPAKFKFSHVEFIDERGPTCKGN